MVDVLIIGGGITGAATAFALSKYNLNIAVVERENDVSCGMTRANSAILHAGYDPTPGTLMAKLNVRGSQMAAELCPKLDVSYRRVGSLVLGFSSEDGGKLQKLYENGIANGVEGLQLLTKTEVQKLEPQVSGDVTAALYAPTAAICSPWEFCLALMETAIRNGAALFLEREVTGMTKIQGGWRVETSKGPMETRYVVNAAGVSAEDVHKLVAPATFHISPSRGQYFLLDKSEGTRALHVLFQCPGPKGKGVLVGPTVGGNLIVGPNAEPVSRARDTGTTAAGLDYVKTRAAQSVPGISFRENIRNFAGVRAVSDTGDFVVESPAEGFLDVAGICSPGLSAAPALGEYAAEQLGNLGLELVPKADFICTRKRLKFYTLTPTERAKLVAEQPAYGRVVCRCETVTEGEMLDTFNTPIPPRSVDGVKRRVGAGMGRCQGGFCGPRVVELLAKTMGVSLGDVPQD
ncbi:MAG: NAD(P)/FAD-dependent oxidoreductase, partial [Oscillospiraceae bacterium]